jgi:malonate transporter
LFTIGAVLWRAGQHAHTRTPPARYLPVAMIKLLLHPLLLLRWAWPRGSWGRRCPTSR